MRPLGTGNPALVRGRAAAVGAGVDGRAARVQRAGGQQGLRLGRSAVIGQRPREWIRVLQITGIGESAVDCIAFSLQLSAFLFTYYVFVSCFFFPLSFVYLSVPLWLNLFHD